MKRLCCGVFFSGVLLLSGWLSVVQGAGDAAAATTFRLTYARDGRRSFHSLPLEDREVSFRKEPDYAGRRIVRSAIQVSPEPGDFIGFACDLDEGVIYFDISRNLDLTDASTAVYQATRRGRQVFFEDITLVVEQDGRRREMVLDFYFFSETRGRYAVKSCWRSDEVTLGGRRYLVEIIDNGDGVINRQDALYLTPAETRRLPLAAAHVVHLHPPGQLILEGDAFDLSYALSDDGRELKLTVQPTEPKLHDVTLGGGQVRRVVMMGRHASVVSFLPDGTLRMPADDYRNASVWVEQGEGEARSLWLARRLSFSLGASTRGDAVWRVGGPLTSSLSHRTRGDRLVFDYHVTGIGQERYVPVGSRSAYGEPGVMIEQDGEVLHIAQFEYG